MPTLLFISWADLGWIALGLFLMFNALSIVVLSLTWLERKALGGCSGGWGRPGAARWG